MGIHKVYCIKSFARNIYSNQSHEVILQAKQWGKESCFKLVCMYLIEQSCILKQMVVYTVEMSISWPHFVIEEALKHSTTLIEQAITIMKLLCCGMVQTPLCNFMVKVGSSLCPALPPLAWCTSKLTNLYLASRLTTYWQNLPHWFPLLCTCSLAHKSLVACILPGLHTASVSAPSVCDHLLQTTSVYPSIISVC